MQNTSSLKNNSLIVLLFLLLQLRIYGQIDPCVNGGCIGGNSQYGDVINAMAVDGSGNIYVTGYFNGTANFDMKFGTYTLSTSSYPSAAFVAKYDASFNLVWAVKLGGGFYTEGHGIVLDASGNVYTTGYGSGDFDPGPGLYNLSGGAYVCKLSNTGSFVWAGSFGGAGCGKSITIDGMGNVCSTGTFSGTSDLDPGAGAVNVTSTGGSDIYISKLDSNGTYVMGKKVGGLNNELAYTIATDAADNIFVGGSYDGPVNFGLGLITTYGVKDAFVYKVNSAGNPIWLKRIGGTNDDEALSLTIDKSDNIICTGYITMQADLDPGAGTYTVYAGYEDPYIVKLDNSGNFLWGNSFGGSKQDRGYSITTDANRNIFTTGEFTKETWGSIDFDPGIGIFNLNGYQQKDIYISKFDSTGNFIWAKELQGYNDDAGKAVAIDANKSLYVAGIVKNAYDYDPNPNYTYYMYNYGYNDGFVMRYPILTVGTPTSNFLNCGADSTGVAVASILDGATPMTFTWSAMSGPLTTQNTLTLTNVPVGLYAFSVTDINGCVTTNTFYINGNPPLSLSVTSTNEDCVGGYNNGSATVTPFGGYWPYTYTWNSSTTQTNNAISNLSAGIYTVSVTDGFSCTTTSTISILKNYNPSEFSYTTNGMIATFSITGTGCNSFLWDFGNSVTSSLNSNPTVTYANAGVYSVCLQCNSMPPSCVRCVTISVPSNSSGAIGIQEYLTDGINAFIYPNPFNFNTTVNLTNSNFSEHYQIHFYDVVGKEVFTTELDNDKTIINRGALVSGIYFYEILGKDKSIAKGKIAVTD